MEPTDDLVAHEHSHDCVCGPAQVPVITGQGDRFALVIHRRLDEGLSDLREELLR